MIVSRRHVAGWLGATALSAMLSRRALARPATPSSLGLNTWSLRALKHGQAIPTILRLMQETGLRDCQLLFSHAEPEEFDPDFAAMASANKPATPQEHDQQRRKTEARAAWRLSVPMAYFTALRTQFVQQGLNIRAYSAPLGNSAEETDRLFLMAKTMGATLFNTRLPEAQTDLVAAAATRHGLLVGIQVTDQRVLAQQLRASPHLQADPDIGDLTKAGASALDFIKENLGRIAAIDLKDAVAHGASVPFGSGAARMQEVLTYVDRRLSHAGLYIDCDYPGTGSSTDEVKRCIRYVRGVTHA